MGGYVREGVACACSVRCVQWQGRCHWLSVPSVLHWCTELGSLACQARGELHAMTSLTAVLLSSFHTTARSPQMQSKEVVTYFAVAIIFGTSSENPFGSFNFHDSPCFDMQTIYNLSHAWHLKSFYWVAEWIMYERLPLRKKIKWFNACLRMCDSVILCHFRYNNADMDTEFYTLISYLYTLVIVWTLIFTDRGFLRLYFCGCVSQYYIES